MFHGNSEFADRWRMDIIPRNLSTVALPPRTRSITITCYPGGNFGGNQLLDGSIGLSPLCSNWTINLHVRTVTDVQPRFLWPSAFSSIVHHLSGLKPMTIDLELDWIHINLPRHRLQLLGPCFKTGSSYPNHTWVDIGKGITFSIVVISWSFSQAVTAFLFTFPSRYFFRYRFTASI